MKFSHCRDRLCTVFSLILFSLLSVQYDRFATLEIWGNLLYAVSLGAALVIWLALTIHWDVPGWFQYSYMVLFFLAVPMVMLVVVERLNGNFILDFLTPDEDIWANYVVYMLLYLLAFALSGSLRISVMSVSPVLLLFGIANMYIKEFKGSPLVPLDFKSIATAASVAAGYTYEIGYEILLGVYLNAMVLAVFSRMNMPTLPLVGRLTPRILSLIVVLGFSYVFYFTDTVANNGYKPDFFNQTRGYKNHGALLEFTLNTKYLWLVEPSGYDADEVDDIVTEQISDGTPSILETALIRQGMSESAAHEIVFSAETAVDQGISPNIIVIMNESFSDLSVVGNIETNIDYMPFINSLTENTIQGNVYVSTIGTGTSNTEYEFLTGNTMAFLPAGSNAYQLYVKDNQPSLVSTMLSLGYSASAFHPYYAYCWNRENVYNYLGFQSFTTWEDLIDEDILTRYKSSGYSYSLFQRLLNQRYPDDDMILRRYISDAYDFSKVEEMYEASGDEPFFIFNVTMQSHSSYATTYDNFDQEVWLTSTTGDYPKTNQYLSLIKKTDEAFEDLISYFENVDEPTIILMFGDHQPFIEDGFYSEVMGESIGSMDDETQQKRYITRFILWANYDIPEGWIDQISMNYLSTLLMQIAGYKLTDYSAYLANLYAELPVITAMGCIDASGNYFQIDDATDLKTLVQGYRKVAYNNLADTENRQNTLFYLAD